MWLCWLAGGLWRSRGASGALNAAPSSTWYHASSARTNIRAPLVAACGDELVLQPVLEQQHSMHSRVVLFSHQPPKTTPTHPTKVRCLLRVSIYHVSYLRGLFPDNMFSGATMNNLGAFACTHAWGSIMLLWRGLICACDDRLLACNMQLASTHMHPPYPRNSQQAASPSRCWGARG